MKNVLLVIYCVLFAVDAFGLEFKPNYSLNNNLLMNKNGNFIKVQLKEQSETELNVEATNKYYTKRNEFENMLNEIKRDSSLKDERLKLMDKIKDELNAYTWNYAKFLVFNLERTSVHTTVRAELYDRQIRGLQRDLEMLKSF